LIGMTCGEIVRCGYDRNFQHFAPQINSHVASLNLEMPHAAPGVGDVRAIEEGEFRPDRLRRSRRVGVQVGDGDAGDGAEHDAQVSQGDAGVVVQRYAHDGAFARPKYRTKKRLVLAPTHVGRPHQVAIAPTLDEGVVLRLEIARVIRIPHFVDEHQRVAVDAHLDGTAGFLDDAVAA